jgi:dihydroorotate dehydrogenase electron transfer subunit
LINSIRTVKIKKIIEVCPDIKTLVFNMDNKVKDDYIQPKPGQFVMAWIPGVDEIPMSISGYNYVGDWSITVKRVGECTNAIFKMKKNDLIGIRGPLGNFFQLPSKKINKVYLVGGGTGIAPLNFLAIQLNKMTIKSVIIEGAKVKEKLLLTNNSKNLNEEFSELVFCTDDGSFGQKGFASDTFKEIIKHESLKTESKVSVYTCGPEKMMYSVFKICEKNKIELQASLERIMRCGCGLCGLCSLDPIGLLVCKDGPVFNSKILREIDDFGKYRRDFSGKKISLE